MIRKNLVSLLALVIAHSASAGTQIQKIVDASGNVTYTNMSSGYKGKIIKRFDSLSGIYHFRNEPRSKLSRNVIKTGLNHYRFAPGSSYPTLYHSFSNYSPYSTASYVNKSRYSGLIADAASRIGVEERLLHAVIQTESAYNPNAVSHAGAVGLMQVMPGTARRYGVFDLNDPVQNIEAGTKYLRDLLLMFNDNLHLAVAAYNAGEGAVMRYNNNIPPYRETQNYVRQVLSLYRGGLY